MFKGVDNRADDRLRIMENVGYSAITLKSILTFFLAMNVFCAVAGQFSDNKIQPSNVGNILESKWTAEIQIRNLLSAGDRSAEEMVLFPQVWKAVVGAGTNPDKYNISIDCADSLKEYSSGLADREPWAVRILDSSGKQGPSMLLGGLTQNGNYDECLNTHHYKELEPNGTLHVHGNRYCSVFFSTPSWLQNFVSTLDVPYHPHMSRVTVDLCVPHTCETNDLLDIVSVFLSNKSYSVVMEEVECFQQEDFASDTAAIVLVAVFSFILLLIFSGTCLDLVERLQKIEALSGEVSEVGFQKHPNRLSRFGTSIRLHWNRLSGGRGSGFDHRRVQRRKTLGDTPGFIRSLSRRILHHRPSLTNDFDHTDLTGREGEGEAKDDESLKGGGNNSHGVASDTSNSIQLTAVMKNLPDNVDTNDNDIISNKTQQVLDGAEPDHISNLQKDDSGFSDVIRDAAVQNDVIRVTPKTPNLDSEVCEMKMVGRPRSDISPESRNQVNESFREVNDHSIHSEGESRFDKSSDGSDESDETEGIDGTSDTRNMTLNSYREKDMTKSTQAQTEKSTRQKKEDVDDNSDMTSIHAATPKPETDCEDRTLQMERSDKDITHSKNGSDKNVALVEEEDFNNNDAGADTPEICLNFDKNLENKPTTDRDKIDKNGEYTDSATKESAPTNMLETAAGRGSVEETRENPDTSTNEVILMAVTVDDTMPDNFPQEPGRKGDIRIAKQDTDQTKRLETLGCDTNPGHVKTISTQNGAEENGKDVSNMSEKLQKYSSSTGDEAIEKVYIVNDEKPKEQTQGISARDQNAQDGTRFGKTQGTTHSSDSKESSPSPEDLPKLLKSISFLDGVMPASPTGTSTTPPSPSPSLHSNISLKGLQSEGSPSPILEWSDADSKSNIITAHQISLTRSLHSIPEEPAEMHFGTNGGIKRTKSPINSHDSEEVGVRHRPKTKTKEEVREQQQRWSHKGCQRHDVEGGKISTERSELAEVLLCFSFIRSVRRVMAEGNSDHLFSMNGMRVLSICWIVLGNTMSMLNGTPANLANNVDTVKMGQSVWFQAIMNATFAADTFFVLSGCLVSYHFLRSKSRELEENPKARLLTFKSLLLFYFHRVMRMVPQHIHKPFALHHISEVLHRRPIPDRCLIKAHTIPMRRRGPEDFAGAQGIYVGYEASVGNFTFMLNESTGVVWIMPCFYVALAICTVLLPHMGNGPRWSVTDEGLKNCRSHWWATAFLFSNYYKPEDMCMPWSYYLVNDFQFYLLSPLVLYPLLLTPALGLVILVFLVVIQIVSTALLVNDNDGNLLSLGDQFFADVYAKPYCRVGTFAVGMALGYFLYSTQRRIYFRKIPLLLGWLISLAVMGTVVYVSVTGMWDRGQSWPTVHSAIYQAFSRPAWSAAVAFIIFVCSIGQGGFVYRFLSWNAFLPLCRITYGVYLLHPILITMVLNASRYPFYMQFGSLIYMYVSNLVCGYGLAFFLITLVESPFTALEAILRKRFLN